MSLGDYISDKKSALPVCFAGGLFFSVLLLFFGVGAAELFLLWLCFAAIIFAAIFSGFLRQRKRLRYLLSLQASLDRKYLIAEIADKPDTKMEQVYFRLMRAALKDMTDEVARSQRRNNEYRDFIEQWVHEIKVPITGIQLICENNKNDITRKIMGQTELIGQDVERVLFYARLENVEKDYLIREIALKDCCLEALAQNRQFLIQSGVRVDMEAVSDSVYSDEKWVCFMLNQIIFNSIKYQSASSPIIRMASWDKGSCVALSVTDNGLGVRESELGRVFDKGFVGSNGRAGKNATGMGLYLCAGLCARLGMEIGMESEAGRYTTVTLYFPKSDHFNL